MVEDRIIRLKENGLDVQKLGKRIKVAGQTLASREIKFKRIETGQGGKAINDIRYV